MPRCNPGTRILRAGAGIPICSLTTRRNIWCPTRHGRGPAVSCAKHPAERSVPASTATFYVGVFSGTKRLRRLRTGKTLGLTGICGGTLIDERLMPFDWLDRRRGLRGQRAGRAARRRARTSACCSSTGGRTSAATPTTTTTTPGILIHQYGPHIFHTNSARDLRLPLALHRVAALRASRAGQVDGQLGAHPDQPRHGEPPVRAER